MANMSCKRCGSEKQSKFGTEMNIHFPGREGLEKPSVVFSLTEVLVCLDCGLSEFTVPDCERRALADGLSWKKAEST
jgi:hypothetical protein